jgi:branched-chain amino acid aminotransferase
VGSALVWIDGAVVPAAEARIPVTDHGLLYGDGVFEGIRVYGAAVFRLDRHLARLRVGASAIGLTIPGGIEFVREVVLETVRAYGESEAYLRVVITRGEGDLGVDPTSCHNPRLFCLVDRVRIFPEQKLREGLDLVVSSLRRPPPDVLDPRVKSLNYLNNALAKLEARRAGADEALLLNSAGRVAEASVANVFVVKDGRLVTPPVTEGALEGITRASILELAESLGIDTRQEPLARYDLLAADEVFLTGSGAGVVPVRSLDGVLIGTGQPGPMVAKLREAFLAAAPGWGVAFR